MHDGMDALEGDDDAVPLKRPRKGIYVLPNLFTLAALFGGFYGMVMAVNGQFMNAAIGIFCAMVLDSLDGRVARMTNTQSAFGEQMDSLSDMVSFGAAPALIAYVWTLQIWVAGAGLLPLCTALAQPCDWRALTSTRMWWISAFFRVCHHRLQLLWWRVLFGGAPIRILFPPAWLGPCFSGPCTRV